MQQTLNFFLQVSREDQGDYLIRSISTKCSINQWISSLLDEGVRMPEWEDGFSAFILMKSRVRLSTHVRLSAWPSAKPNVLDLLW